MSQSIPSFWGSPYFVPEPDNWHLTEDAPEELKKEFAEYMKIKRNKDGTIEGMTTMGDSVKEKFTDEEKKRQEMKKKYDKKYAVGTVR